MSGENIAKLLYSISYGAFALSAVCLVLAVVFFLKFRILSVIDDLSGRTARKGIEQLRRENEKAGKRPHRPGIVNEKRGRLTEPIQKGKGETTKTQAADPDVRPETGLLEENRATGQRAAQTGLLSEEGTTVLSGSGETEALDASVETEKLREGGVKLELLEEVMEIHTEETI